MPTSAAIVSWNNNTKNKGEKCKKQGFCGMVEEKNIQKNKLIA